MELVALASSTSLVEHPAEDDNQVNGQLKINAMENYSIYDDTDIFMLFSRAELRYKKTIHEEKNKTVMIIVVLIFVLLS